MFIISTIIKEGLAQFSIRAGKKINSYSLIADGWHHRSDAIVSFLILIGIFLGEYFWWVDSIMGIVVSLLIFYTAYNISKNAISALIGEKPDENLISEIRKIVNYNISRDVKLHHLHFHIYGNKKELTFHIRLPGDMRLEEAHQVATNLEEKIKEKIEYQGRRREIPSTRFPSKYDVDTIILKMTQVLHLKRNIIFDKKRGNLYRPLAIYLIKRFTPLSLSEIGKLFKMDYSAVSQAAKRFEQKSEVNDEIKEIVQKAVTTLKEE